METLFYEILAAVALITVIVSIAYLFTNSDEKVEETQERVEPTVSNPLVVEETYATKPKLDKIMTYKVVIDALANILERFERDDYELILPEGSVQFRTKNFKNGRDWTVLTDEDKRVIFRIIEDYNQGKLLVAPARAFENSASTGFVAVTNKASLRAVINFALGGLEKSADVYYRIHRESSNH